MSDTTTATGVLGDRLPYVRIAGGPAPLVVLPGLSLTGELPGGLALRAYARGFGRLLGEHTVYVVQRPHGLADGASTRGIAAAYASVLAAELGPFRLMGLSTGGLIAQELALDRPDLVQRLVLAVSGTRLAPAGRTLCEHWLELAAQGRWRSLRGGLGRSAVDGPFAQALAGFLLALPGGSPTGAEAADFATTVRAVLAHDTRRRLARLTTPTLVVGGALDPFFPEAILRETAAALPAAAVHVFPRNGHGVPKHRAGEMQELVAAFLSG